MPGIVPVTSTKGTVAARGHFHISLPVRETVSAWGSRFFFSALIAAQRATSSADRSPVLMNRSAAVTSRFNALSQRIAAKDELGCAPPVYSESVRIRLNSLPVSAPGVISIDLL